MYIRYCRTGMEFIYRTFECKTRDTCKYGFMLIINIERRQHRFTFLQALFMIDATLIHY